MDEPTIITMEERPTLAARGACTMATIGEEIGRTLGKVHQFLTERGIEPASAPYVRYFTAATEGDMDIESGVAVVTPQSGGGDVVASSLPACEAMRYLHVGPYDLLPKAHEHVHESIAARSLQLADAPWEVYLNDPRTTDPADLQTEVIYPIARPS